MKSPTTTQRTMWVHPFFFFPPQIHPPSSVAPTNIHGSHRHSLLLCLCYPASLSCPPFHPLIFPPLLHFPSPIHHIHVFFSPWLSVPLPFAAIPPCFASSPGFSSSVASSLSSLLPPFLRWRGFCHVSPLIDRWDVWAGYTVALLGSNCSRSLSLSLPPSSCFLSLSPPH